MCDSLAADLERHRKLDSDLADLARPRGAEEDPLGLRDVVIQARSDAYNLGLQLGAVVATAWLLRKMRGLVSSPEQSFAAFADEVATEVTELELP